MTVLLQGVRWGGGVRHLWGGQSTASLRRAERPTGGAEREKGGREPRVYVHVRRMLLRACSSVCLRVCERSAGAAQRQEDPESPRAGDRFPPPANPPPPAL